MESVSMNIQIEKSVESFAEKNQYFPLIRKGKCNISYYILKKITKT